MDVVLHFRYLHSIIYSSNRIFFEPNLLFKTDGVKLAHNLVSFAVCIPICFEQ